jgi:tRNA modification GTPase
VRAAEADLVLWLVDDDRHVDRSQGAIPIWTVRNKIDLEIAKRDFEAASSAPGVRPQTQGIDLQISAACGDGIADLVAALVAFARDYFGTEGGGMLGRVRQRELLQQAAASLQCSIDVLADGEELAAEELRVAAGALGRLLGRVDVEDVLGAIFSTFCIGK